MQLTRACEYGFQGLIALARHPHGEVVMLEALAADAGVPFSFLGKIFQSLVKSGLVRSVRGSGGGFSFSRDLSQINLLEIVEAIDGKINLRRCNQSRPECQIEGGCAVCVVFGEVQDRMTDVLRTKSLRDLIFRDAPSRLGAPLGSATSGRGMIPENHEALPSRE